MKEQIGNTAGNIWQALKEQEEINIAQLSRKLKEKTIITYQALGWLAREDKIKYVTKGSKTFIALNDQERNV